LLLFLFYVVILSAAKDPCILPLPLPLPLPSPLSLSFFFVFAFYVFAFAFVLAARYGEASASRLKTAAKRPPLHPERSRMTQRSPKGEATDSTAFAVACFYFSRFWPKNRMSSPETTQLFQTKQHPVGMLVTLNPI